MLPVPRFAVTTSLMPSLVTSPAAIATGNGDFAEAGSPNWAGASNNAKAGTTVAPAIPAVTRTATTREAGIRTHAQAGQGVTFTDFPSAEGTRRPQTSQTNRTYPCELTPAGRRYPVYRE